MADMPIKELGDEAPEYDRPWTPSPALPVIDAAAISPPLSNAAALLKLVGSPDQCSKRWVYEQYDTLILGNSVVTPGGDAGLIRIGDGPKGLAMTCDVTPRYCEADPVEGGKQAVAEAWRNLTAVGATPLAITDNLNFGNPERPHAMGQLVGCIRGIGEACVALDFPVVSGNVSLYNETNGQGILPTPTIGGVGVLADVARHATIAFKGAGDAVILVGDCVGWLGQSIWLRDICGQPEGAPPPVDLAVERRNGEAVRGLITAGELTAVHDLSDGGLALALAEMAMAGGIGARIDAVPGALPSHAALFGEDQARYVVTCAAANADRVMKALAAAGVPVHLMGETGGDALLLPGEAPIPVKQLQAAHEGWFPAFMKA
jgi:phosphoribosylformylglycinamidine synthase